MDARRVESYGTERNGRKEKEGERGRSPCRMSCCDDCVRSVKLAQINPTLDADDRICVDPNVISNVVPFFENGNGGKKTRKKTSIFRTQQKSAFEAEPEKTHLTSHLHVEKLSDLGFRQRAGPM